MKSKYDLLRNKKILSILDGDVHFGDFEANEGKQGVTISMPYLSGPVICNILTTFGLVKYYGCGDAQSRWSYLDDLFEYCISNKKTNDLLCYLFNLLGFNSPPFRAVQLISKLR